MGDLEINLAAKELYLNGKIGRLSRRECKIIECLSKFKHPVSADELANCVYKDETDGGPDTGYVVIRTQISILRRKLYKFSGGKQYIDSYGWSGYKLRECDWKNWFITNSKKGKDGSKNKQ